MSTGRRYTDIALYKRLFLDAKAFWPHIAGLFSVSMLATPLTLINPVPLKIVVDSVLGSEPLPGWMEVLVPQRIAADQETLLLLMTAMVLIVAVLIYLQSLVLWVLQAYTGEKLQLAFRARLFRHVQDLSFAYHDSKGSMDSLYRIQNDTPAIQNVATQGLIPLVSDALTLLGMVVVTALIDIHLALAALVVIPPLFILTNLARGRLRKKWVRLKRHESSAWSVVQETLGALRVVKAFGREEHHSKRFVTKSNKVVSGQVQVALTEGGFDLLIGFTIAAGTTAVLFIGVKHVQGGSLSLGDLLLIMAYLAQVYAPLESISKRFAQLQSSLASAERVYAVLDSAPHVSEKPGANRLRRASGEVTFDGVTYGFEPERPILERVSFRVTPGTRVGILGETGSGKTTLVNLMLRFYDPDAGVIRIDGINVRDIQLDDLRRQFAMVLQEPVLFSASIAENIAYSRPDATEAQIIAAARSANVHDFILSLPQGYDTEIGERGMTLSGGERQRISLARAFLRDAPILILDEPTSSIDVATEQAIMEALHPLISDRTTFLIAHRLSTLQDCDMWLRLAPGKHIQVFDTPPQALEERNSWMAFSS